MYENLSQATLVEYLNDQDKNVRLNALKEVKRRLDEKIILSPEFGNDVNNHIHTSYSFSPYSPTKAIYMAYMSGLTTAGIMDHDAMGGAKEFIEAGKIMGMATTVGVECRVLMNKTPLNGRRINNPDQKSIAYCAIHGVAHQMIDRVNEFFLPYTKERNKRNEKMVDNINSLLSEADIKIDFEKDVLPLSMYGSNGSVTERHLMYATANKLIERFSKGKALIECLEKLDISLSPKITEYLLDEQNPHYAYDLLGALKGNMVSKIYVDADSECPDVDEYIKLAKEVGGISAYAYLGDVGDSVTGDKKAQKFEDDYLDELFEIIKAKGFNAVTYMPTRNTLEQLLRIKDLCKKHDLFEISGEDINQPRQKFISEGMKNPVFANLIDSTWALIGHELSVSKDIKLGMFEDTTTALDERIEKYKKVAKGV